MKPDQSSEATASRKGSVRLLAASFQYAFAGLWFLFRTQQNARVEALLGLLAIALGVWLKITAAEWAVTIFTIALVLILEGLNTSIEAAVDLACPRPDPLAKAAKDLAAGMVLVAAIGSLGVSAFIFGPRLVAKLLG